MGRKHLRITPLALYLVKGLTTEELVYWYAQRSRKSSSTAAAASSEEPELGRDPFRVGRTLGERCMSNGVTTLLHRAIVAEIERRDDEVPVLHDDVAEVFRGIATAGVGLTVDVRSYLEEWCLTAEAERVWIGTLRPLQADGVRYIFPLELRRLTTPHQLQELAQQDPDAVDSLVQHMVRAARRGDKPFYVKRGLWISRIDRRDE